MKSDTSAVSQEIGARVRSARHEKGLSLEGLSRLTELSWVTIQRIETGGGFRMQSLGKIAAALDIDVRELLGDKSEPVPPAQNGEEPATSPAAATSSADQVEARSAAESA